jgi:hypothetical protein
VQLGCIEPFDLNIVFAGPVKQGVHPHPFGFVRGDDQLAAIDIRDIVRLAEGNRRRDAFPAQFGLEAAGGKIDAGMNDAAIMPRLMLPDSAFLLKNEDPGAGMAFRKLQSARQSDNSGAYHTDIVHGQTSALFCVSIVLNFGNAPSAKPMAEPGEAEPPPQKRRPPATCTTPARTRDLTVRLPRRPRGTRRQCR